MSFGGCFGVCSDSRSHCGASGLGSHGYCAIILGGSCCLAASVFGLLCNTPIAIRCCQNTLTPIPFPYPQSPCGESSLPAGRSLSTSPNPTPAQRGPQRSRGMSRRPTACGRERGRPPARTGPHASGVGKGRAPSPLSRGFCCPATSAGDPFTTGRTCTCEDGPSKRAARWGQGAPHQKGRGFCPSSH